MELGHLGVSMRVAFDFETEGIQDWPEYPPKPAGLSIWNDGAPSGKYYAFKHPTENNATFEEAVTALRQVWEDESAELIAWNKPFDQLVAHVHFKLPLVPKCKMHDGLVLAFLLDPHARELGLKPLAEKYLGMPPEERDAVKDWLVSHGICRDSKTKWGEHISKAPGALVGLYANGDTLRTLRLFDALYSRVVALGMLEAYERELRLQDVMLKASLRGVPVNSHRLGQDISMYDVALRRIDQRIFELLNSAPFNIDSGPQLADALDRVIPNIQWPLTATGKRSTSKDNLAKILGSLQGELLACLQYRASVATCVDTFMRVWYNQATSSNGDGRIHCTWNTTRSDEAGARTGRLSSSPNFMNIPTLKSNKFSKAVKLWEEYLKAQDYPPLPNVRSYIEAPAGYKIVKRDFSSQELRVLAHYEDGPLLAAYKANPKLDMHQWAADTINALTGLSLTRKHTKTIAFAILYGSGLATLAEQMGCDETEAAKAKNAYMEAVPGIRILSDGLTARASNGKPIKTYGGRLYHVEPARWDPKRGRMQTFYYKLINVLIQGGSADITKEAILAYDAQAKHGEFLLTVHDELVIMVRDEHVVDEMAILRNCMDAIPLDCPLESEGEVGQNYHEMEDYKEAA